MSGLTLTEFLLARIAEDEEVAYQAQGLLGLVTDWHTVENLRERGLTRADSYHVNRWSSARVLTECEAKRRIVDLHAITEDRDWINPSDGPAYQEVNLMCDVCGWFENCCDTIKALALPYADHSDYRAEWAPDN